MPLGSELLTNGDMEIGNPPSNWVASGDNILATDTERTGGSGSQSLKITLGAGDPQSWAAGQGVTLVNGLLYKLSAWKKVGTAPGVCLVINNTQLTTTTSTTWIKQEFDIIGAGTTTVYLRVGGVSGNTGFFDDVSLRLQSGRGRTLGMGFGGNLL